MSNHNNFDPLVNSLGTFEITHLKDLSVRLSITFDNGDERLITVHIRPTNHLFSRKPEDEDWLNRADLTSKKLWLTSYVHHEANFQQTIEPLKVKEHRVFCEEKWNESFYLPEFARLIEENPSQTTVLANEGDEKTCLSGIMEIDDRPDEVYLVFFSLKKVNSKEVNMLIESGYCVSKQEHGKAKRLISSDRSGKKPFLIVIRNIQEGRFPLESKTVKKRKNSQRKGKAKSKKP